MNLFGIFKHKNPVLIAVNENRMRTIIEDYMDGGNKKQYSEKITGMLK